MVGGVRCMAERGTCEGGACVAGGCCCKGACVTGRHAWWGHAWQGVCISGDMATEAGGTHSSVIHLILLPINLIITSSKLRQISDLHLKHLRKGQIELVTQMVSRLTRLPLSIQRKDTSVYSNSWRSSDFSY